jgi:hypothetical protein
VNPQFVHYNCVCDEEVSLRCSNTECGRDIQPDGAMVVTPDGTVFCSKECAGVARGDGKWTGRA